LRLKIKSYPKTPTKQKKKILLAPDFIYGHFKPVLRVAGYNRTINQKIKP